MCFKTKQSIHVDRSLYIYNDAATGAAVTPAGQIKLNMAICHASWVLTVVIVVVVAGAAPHHLLVRGASDDDGGPSSPSALAGCDLFRGRWVADKSYPLYDASTCPFVPDVFDCRRNGRPDDAYLKFRWSPANCRLPRWMDALWINITTCMHIYAQVQNAQLITLSPYICIYIYICRFDGADFLRRWRGKTVMFVGDSLSMNQWVSLACMLHAAAAAPVRATFTSGEPVSSVRFEVSSIAELWSGLRIGSIHQIVQTVSKLLMDLLDLSSGLRPVPGAVPHDVPGGRRAGGHRPGAQAGLHAERQRVARRAPARLQHMALVDIQGRQPSVRMWCGRSIISPQQQSYILLLPTVLFTKANKCRAGGTTCRTGIARTGTWTG